MIPKPFSEMGPVEREAYLKALSRRVYKARAQIDAGRRNFAVVVHSLDDGFDSYRAPRQTLELGGLDGVSVMYEWDQILSEIQSVLKTVNEISGEKLNTVRHRLLSELQGAPHGEEKAKSGSRPNCD